MEIVQINNLVYNIDDEIIKILLKDKNTGKNIIFATSNYSKKGYYETDEIKVEFLKYRSRALIRARIDKSKEEQRIRSKEKAEVFTPSWVCNKQNNLVDNAWFNRNDVFNLEKDKTWITNKDKIDFSNTNKTWKDYVNDIRLEITCGEAPYLTSRYDTVNGEYIPVEERIGLLDRKLRIVSENCESKEEWIEWAINAYNSIYGYEFQGDNLLIARENLLLTYIDYYKYKFDEEPLDESLKVIAKIISYNIFQMDGLTFIVPFSWSKKKTFKIINIFGEEEIIGLKDENQNFNDSYIQNGISAKIKDWKKNKLVEFSTLLRG